MNNPLDAQKSREIADLKFSLRFAEKGNPKAMYDEARYYERYHEEDPGLYWESICLVSLANELIADVERDIYEWSTWESGDYQKWHDEIIEAVAKLKTLLHESPPKMLLEWPANAKYREKT